MRDIVDAIRYLTHNGPLWRALPAAFPARLDRVLLAGKWQADGSTARMHDDLHAFKVLPRRWVVERTLSW